MAMIDHLLTYAFPAAYSLLPPKMNSPEATAMLLAIALQESKVQTRRQARGGPGRGFWQFERGEVRQDGTATGGTAGIVVHRASRPHLLQLLKDLQYPTGQPVHEVIRVLHEAIAHNDTLAVGAARLLLWTLPRRLPARDNPTEGWVQYLATWNPGKPHPETWHANFATAWTHIEGEE